MSAKYVFLVALLFVGIPSVRCGNKFTKPVLTGERFQSYFETLKDPLKFIELFLSYQDTKLTTFPKAAEVKDCGPFVRMSNLPRRKATEEVDTAIMPLMAVEWGKPANQQFRLIFKWRCEGPGGMDSLLEVAFTNPDTKVPTSQVGKLVAAFERGEWVPEGGEEEEGEEEEGPLPPQQTSQGTGSRERAKSLIQLLGLEEWLNPQGEPNYPAVLIGRNKNSYSLTTVFKCSDITGNDYFEFIVELIFISVILLSDMIASYLLSVYFFCLFSANSEAMLCTRLQNL